MNYTIEQLKAIYPNYVDCRLTKNKAREDALFKSEIRTDTVEGICSNSKPEVGKSFTVIGKALNPKANARSVTTSVIQKVTQTSPNTWELATLNSVYTLELL